MRLQFLTVLLHLYRRYFQDWACSGSVCYPTWLNRHRNVLGNVDDIVTEESKSYARILRVSSIMGGAASINLILSMMRVKFAAILIGVSGVGLLASLTAIQSLVGTLAGLGIQSSAVRDVASAMAKNNLEAIGRTLFALRRICWLSGLTGMVGLILLSPYVSRITFGQPGYSFDIGALGIVILLTNLSGGQMAQIQGMRRIGDMARANIISGTLATLSAIGCYAWLGQRGIVPALVAVAAIQLALSWYFARQVPVTKVALTWRQTFLEAEGMLTMGLAFMWNALLNSAVTYLTVIMITQHTGLKAVGLFSAAFALSGYFVNFILAAMSADYYPRLTGAVGDQAAVNRLVNEQTEIGLLIAAPALVAMMALAPVMVWLLYSTEFSGAADLMRWFILGCACRMIAWPLGYVMLALGKRGWFFGTETLFNVLHLLLIAVGLRAIGIEGVAVSFFIMYIGYTYCVYLVARRLTEFAWSTSCRKVTWICMSTIVASFLFAKILPTGTEIALGALLTAGTTLYCLRGLVQRVGAQHRLARAAGRIPAVRAIIGL